MWRGLSARGAEPSIPAKMVLGMVLCSLSFLLLYFVARAGETAPVTSEMYASGDFSLVERGLRRLEAEGVPQDVIDRLQKKDENGKFVFLGKKFATDKDSTGEAKLKEALGKLLTPSQVEEYYTAIRSQAYLFKASPWWLILAYGIMTLGELMFSPMGLALVSKVAPVRLRGMMMGGWFVATSIGNALTIIGVFWDVWLQSTFFIVLSGLALSMGLLLGLLLRPLNKAMPGV
jgi:dipeptide/tripeptide permease